MATHPALKVEIAFGSTPLDTTPTYTDVSIYVRSTGTPVTIRRGRQNELNNFDPGSCVLTLSNRDRRFDASYAAGPYFGQLLPRTPIRVTAVWNAVDYVMFTGWVTGFPQSFRSPDGKDATVTIEAVDALTWLGTTQLPNDIVYSYANDTVGSLAFFLRQGTSTQWSDATSNGYFAWVSVGTGHTTLETSPVITIRTGDHKTHKQQGRRGRSKGG